MIIRSGKQHPDLVAALCDISRSEIKRKHQARLLNPDWQDNPETLIWQLKHGNLAADNADYLIRVGADGRPMCGAGYYRHPTFSCWGHPVSIVMARMYTVPEHRAQFLGTELLIEMCRSIDRQVVTLTFNEDNHNIYESLVNKSSGLMWPPVWSSFRPLGRHYINETWQWLAAALTRDIRHYR